VSERSTTIATPTNDLALYGYAHAMTRSKCVLCSFTTDTAERRDEHELSKHKIDRYLGRRLRPLAGGQWEVFGGVRRRYQAKKDARAAIDGSAGHSVHATSAGLPGLGKRR